MHDHSNWRALYPFASHSTRVDGHRYHYVDQGQGDVLLLVHGNPTWSFYWRELIRGLSDTYRVIAMDHLGCGLSDKPRRYEYRLARHITNLTGFVEELDLGGITLVAHDWGGPIGLGAALASPQRFARFVMLNTAAFRARRMPWRIRVCRTPVFGRLAVQGLNLFTRAALRMAVVRHERMTRQVRAGVLAPYGSWHDRQAIYRFVQDIPMSPRQPSYATLANIESRLPSLTTCAWMFIWGMRDWCFTPEFLDHFTNLVPNATVHRLPEAGHWVVEDAHELIAPLVRQFMEQHPLGTTTRQGTAHL